MSNTSAETIVSNTNTWKRGQIIVKPKNNNNTWKRAQIIVKTKNDNFFKNNSKLTKNNLDKINKLTKCNNKHCYYCDCKFNEIVCTCLENRSDMSSITTNDSY